MKIPCKNDIKKVNIPRFFTCHGLTFINIRHNYTMSLPLSRDDTTASEPPLSHHHCRITTIKPSLYVAPLLSGYRCCCHTTTVIHYNITPVSHHYCQTTTVTPQLSNYRCRTTTVTPLVLYHYAITSLSHHNYQTTIAAPLDHYCYTITLIIKFICDTKLNVRHP